MQQSIDNWNLPYIYSWCQTALHTVVIATAVYCALNAVYWWLKFYKIRKNLRDHWHGPKCHWFWGHMGMVTQGNKNPKGFITYFTEKEKEFPEGFTVYAGPFSARLMLYDPNAVKQVLSATAYEAPKSSAAYQTLVPWLGKGLLVLNNNKWLRHRRLLTSAFHFDILKPYVAIMNECSNTLVKKWSSLIGEGKKAQVEIFEQASLMTLDAILQCLMSYKSECQIQQKKNPYIASIYELSKLIILKQRSKNLMTRLGFLYNRTEEGKTFQRECDAVHAFSETMIDHRQHEQKNETAKKRNYMDFLDMLLQAKDADGEGLSREEIRAEVDTFMFEGHDTTASALSWTMYCMAINPEHQERCVEEINSVLKDRENVKWSDLSSLPHVTRCIKESLRMHPPVPDVLRRLEKDINVGERKILKGTIVWLSIIGVQRNEKFWKDPQTFNPARFTTESSANQNNHAFIPFAAGPRNCIGQHFAMNELKIAVAHILRKFRISIDKDVDIIPNVEIIYRAKGGLPLNIERR